MSEEKQQGKHETWTPDGVRASSEGAASRKVSSKKRPAKRKPAKRRRPKDDNGDLTERQRRFVEEYMADPKNAWRAAQRAGFTGAEGSLRTTASRLLTKANIRAAIQQRAESDPRVANREERQQFWTRVMMGKPHTELVRDRKGKTKEVQVSPSMRERLRAAQLLGMSQGDFVMKHEHNVVGAKLRAALELARKNRAANGSGVT